MPVQMPIPARPRLRPHALIAVALLLLSLSATPQAAAQERQRDEPERITITATLEAPDPRSVPGQVTVIDEEQIDASAPKSVADVIEPVLGVALTEYGGANASSLVSIRGSSAEQVLILLNGKRLNTAQGGGVDLSTINPESIQRIEVHRGGSSALYGENAVGGIVNIITKSPEDSGLTGSVRAGYGSFDTLYGSGSVSGAFGGDAERFAFTVSAHGLQSRGDYAFEDEHFGTVERENADTLRGGASTRLFYRPTERVELDAQASLYLDAKGVPGTVEFPSDSARMEDERETAGLEARWDSGIGELVFDGGFTRQLREYRDPESRFGSVRDRHANRAWDLETRYEDTYGGSRLAASWSGGYAFRHDVLDSTALAGSGGTQYADDDIVRIRHSLFARGELQLFPYEESEATRLGIFPALRWDGWSAEAVSEVDASEGSRPSWTLGVVSALDPQRRIVLKSSVGSSYRVPSFDDLFWPGSAFAVGNPSLEPEEALSVDGGVVLSPIPALHIEASAFYRRVRNLIHWTPGPNGQWRPVNIGRTRFSGIESGVRALIDVPALSSYLEASASGSYLRAEDRSEGSASFGETIPGKPRWQASAIVSMTHLTGHSLRAELRSVGRRYITAANTKWFEPYAVLDLAATVALGAGFEMRLIGENLFDVSYVDLREYPVPGREVRAEVRYAF